MSFLETSQSESSRSPWPEVLSVPQVSPESSQPSQPLEQKRVSVWIVLRYGLSFVVWFFEGGRLVREVGPGRRPLERYEFEQPEARDVRPSGWMF